MSKFHIPKEELNRLTKEHTTKEIAERYGCSVCVIHKRYKEYGITPFTYRRRAKDGMKECSRCGEKKNTMEFHKRSSKPDGCSPWCASCSRVYEVKTKEQRRHRIWATNTLTSHRKRGYIVAADLTADWLEAHAKEAKTCSYCGTKLDWGKKDKPTLISPTLDRVNNEQTMSRNNVEIICMWCNRGKSNARMFEFVEHCKMIVDKFGEEVWLP